MPPTDRKRSLASRETSASNGMRMPKQQKRTRFASPGQDPISFEEQVDAALETPSAAHKGRINTEVYDSDSSDDGERIVESHERGGKKEDNDDNEDMFAIGEKEDNVEQSGSKKKKKKEKFLWLGDIEGQEFADSQGLAEDSLSEDEDEPEDDDDAERRRKIGMGYELSGFNMREEMEEGKFTVDGTFVRTFDPHGVHDRWMDGLDEQEIKKARRNKKMRERMERERIQKENDNALSKEDAEKELAGYLHKGETVLEALQRLGAARKNEKSKRPIAKKLVNGMELYAFHTTATSAIQNIITRITDLASILMSNGNIDIYSAPYEQLLRSVRAAGEVSPDWVPPSQQVEYEYRWATETKDQPPDPPQVYGPYRHEEMIAWHDAKYFGEEGERVRVRTVGDNDWHEWEEVIF